MKLAAVAFVAASALAAWVSSWPVGLRGAGYIAAVTMASLAMLSAYRWASSTTDVWWAGSCGVLARFLLVAVPPYTTHDVTRYMFDGAVSLAGFDPYTVANGDARLGALHALWPSALEHAKYPTIYPPLALAVFTLCASFGPALAWVVWKGILALGSAATVVLARRIVPDPRHFVLVALSPVLVFEGGIGGHVDVMCAFAVAGALACGPRFGRGAWLATGVLWKITPGFLMLPLVVAEWRSSRRRAVELVAGFLVVLGLGYGGAILLGYEAVGSLRVFFAKWSFGSPWMLVEDLIELPRAVLLPVGALVTCGMLVVSAKAAWHGRVGVALLAACAAPLVASPVVFPWYLCTLAVLVALAPSRYALAWMLLMPLTYEVIDRFDVDTSWFPSLWPVQLIVALLGVLLILRHREDLFRRAA